MLDPSFSINLDLEEIGRTLKDSSLLYVLMTVHSMELDFCGTGPGRTRYTRILHTQYDKRMSYLWALE